MDGGSSHNVIEKIKEEISDNDILINEPDKEFW